MSYWTRQWLVISGHQAPRSLSGHLIQPPLLQFPESLTCPQPSQHALGVQQHFPRQVPCTGSTLYIHSLALGMHLLMHLETTRPSQPPATDRRNCSFLYLYRNKGIMEDTTQILHYFVNKTPSLLVHGQMSKRNSVSSVHLPSPLQKSLLLLLFRSSFFLKGRRRICC